MARSLLTVMRAAINGFSLDGEVPLLTLEYQHSTIAPIRVVHNTEDITSNGNLYKAMPFDAKMMNEEQGTLPTSQISYYDMDLELTTLIRSITPDNPIKVKGRLLLASQPDNDQVTSWTWTVLETIWNSERAVTMKIGPRAVLKTQFPIHTVDPGKCPGIFGGKIT